MPDDNDSKGDAHGLDDDALLEALHLLRDVHRMCREQDARLARIEAELYSIKKRELGSMGPSTAPPRPPSTKSSPKRAVARTRPALARVHRKYRKLRTDPERFFLDAQSPMVRVVLGRAYTLVSGGGRAR